MLITYLIRTVLVNKFSSEHILVYLLVPTPFYILIEGDPFGSEPKYKKILMKQLAPLGP